MDTEFHYYVTYLIAIKAGFSCSDAYKIAYSSQYVDDNYDNVKIYNKEKKLIYRNILTQSYNGLLSREDANKIYPVYHFIPSGVHHCKSARADCKTHHLDTVPDNKNAISALHYALNSCNPYLIGIASHAFVDSWSHQNFTGTKDCYNAMPGMLRSMIANIGHADAIADPDYIGYIWRDPRLVNQTIHNNQRFIFAALRLLEEYMLFFKESRRMIKLMLKKTRSELLEAFGCSTRFLLLNLLFLYKKRLKRYNALSVLYDKLDIAPYSKKNWFNAVVTKNMFSNLYYWKTVQYNQSEWYLFQCAARKHHEFIWPILENHLE